MTGLVPLRFPRRWFVGLPMLLAAGVTARHQLVARALERGGPSTASPVRRLSHPGLLDLQVNGYAGVDYNDPATTTDQVHASIAAMRAHGVTRLLPTLISSSLDHFTRCARTLLDARSPAILGLHMEGPYISSEDGARGAHRREDVSLPSVDDFERRMAAADGRIRLLTVAPEVPGVLRVIERATARGVRVGIGHTAASPAQVRDAVLAGATLSTHLGNGCAQVLPRHPNFLWEQLAADELTAGLIVDGHHLPASTVKAMVRAKTVNRVALVTDAIAAAGQPPGEYQLGAMRVRLDPNGRVAVPGQPNLAGSSLSLDQAVGNVVRFAGVSLEDALAMASAVPAAYLGVEPAGRLDLEWSADTSTLRVLQVHDA